MPSTRVLPIGHLRRLIVALRPNDQSLFLEPLGDWVHRIVAGKSPEPTPSSRGDQLPISGGMLSREPLELGKAYHQAVTVNDPGIPPTPVTRVDSHQGEDVVGDPGVRRGDAATPSPDISLTDREVTEDPGTMSPRNASALSDLELTPAVDPTQLSEEKIVQSLAKTMVETMPRSRAGSPEDSNYLPENLAELFVKKEFVNPQVKALLYGLDSINCRELADELHEFARDIGVTDSQNAPLVSGQGNTASI